MKNKAIQGQYVDIYNRYLLGEVTINYIMSSWMAKARAKGMPVAWRSIEYSNEGLYQVLLRKGARHPNAAKLVAVYLASLEGARFTLEEADAGNLYYPGNYEHDIRLQDEKEGLRVVQKEAFPELMDFTDSKERERWQDEIKLILQTGGR